MNKDAADIKKLMEKQIFKNFSDKGFIKLALKIFRYQYENNAIYREYVNGLGAEAESVLRLEEIPFLPISFFKSQRVITKVIDTKYEYIFHSSTTTSEIPSKHFIEDIALYKNSFRKGFAHFYGDIKQYCLLALLPSYLERGNSSLVYMVNQLIKDTQNPGSGFYMYNYKELADKVRMNEQGGKKTLLLGVTYALLKLAEEYPMELKNTIIMETGGMKGRGEELTREEVHKILGSAFKTKNIHSEYGMTELLSQAYSQGNGIFQCVPWMKVLIRDIYDPFSIANSPVSTGTGGHQLIANSRQGAINIIDLANLNSCSFIATDDLGIVYENGNFEVLGRLDNSDIRGCNLLINHEQ